MAARPEISPARAFWAAFAASAALAHAPQARGYQIDVESAPAAGTGECAPVEWSAAPMLRTMTAVAEKDRAPFKYEDLEAGMEPRLLKAKVEQAYLRGEASQIQDLGLSGTDAIFVLNFMKGPKDEASRCQQKILMESLDNLSQYARQPVRLLNITLEDESGRPAPELVEYYKRIYAVNRLGRLQGRTGDDRTLAGETIPYIAVMQGGKIFWDYSIQYDAAYTPHETIIPSELTRLVATLNASLPPDYVAAKSERDDVEQDCTGLPRKKRPEPLDPAFADKGKGGERTDSYGRVIKLDKSGYPKRYRAPKGALCHSWGASFRDVAMTTPALWLEGVEAAFSEGRLHYNYATAPEITSSQSPTIAYQELRNLANSQSYLGAGTFIDARFQYPGALSFGKGDYLAPVILHFVAQEPMDSIKDPGEAFRFRDIEYHFHADGVQPLLKDHVPEEDVKDFDRTGKDKNNFDIVLEELMQQYGKPEGYKKYLKDTQSRFVHLVWGESDHFPETGPDGGAGISLVFDRETRLGTVVISDSVMHNATAARFNATGNDVAYRIQHLGGVEGKSIWMERFAPAKMIDVTPEQQERLKLAEETLPPVVDLSYVVREHKGVIKKAINDIHHYYIANAKPRERVMMIFDKSNVKPAREAVEMFNSGGKQINYIVYAQARGDAKDMLVFFETPSPSSDDPRKDTTLEDVYSPLVPKPYYIVSLAGVSTDRKQALADILPSIVSKMAKIPEDAPAAPHY